MDNTESEPKPDTSVAPTCLDDAISLVQPIIDHARKLLEQLAKRSVEAGKPVEQGKQTGDFMPIAFLLSTQRGIDMLELSFNSNLDKAMAVRAVRLSAVALVEDGLWGVMLIMDTRIWMVRDRTEAARKAGITEAELARLLEADPWRVRKYGTLQEGLMVMLETYRGDYCARLGYTRLADGSIAWEPPDTQLGRVEGRFTNLLPPPYEDHAKA